MSWAFNISAVLSQSQISPPRSGNPGLYQGITAVGPIIPRPPEPCKREVRKKPTHPKPAKCTKESPMDCILRTCTFALCLTALSTGIAFPQAASDATPAATVTASPVAHVYVGTTGGIYLYDAAPNGGLSPAAGSPYKNTVGL